MKLLKFIISVWFLRNSYMEKTKKERALQKHLMLSQVWKYTFKRNSVLFCWPTCCILILHPCMLWLQVFLLLWRWFWAATPEWPQFNPVTKLQVTLNFYLWPTENMVSITGLLCFSVFGKNGNLGEHRIYISVNVLVCIFSKHHHHPLASFCLSRFQTLLFLLWITHL